MGTASSPGEEEFASIADNDEIRVFTSDAVARGVWGSWRYVNVGGHVVMSVIS